MYEHNSTPAINHSDPQPSVPKKPNSTTVKLGSLLIGFCFYFFIGGVLIWNNQTAQNFAIHNSWLLIGLLIVMVCGLIIIWIKQDLIAASAKKQIGIILFFVIPVLLTLVGTVFLLPARFQIIILRVVFLLIASLLPAVMYYLFIASRKYSLLHEYFTNLARLGLFERQVFNGTDNISRPEPEFERRMRVISYTQKFEAAYGPIPDSFIIALLNTTDPDNTDNLESSDQELQRYATGVGGYFSPETTIPVVLASLLIGLGWVLTLPPWEIIEGLTAGDETGKLRHVLLPQQIPVHFAFLGAYFFSVQMLFRRFVRKDLRANAYIAITQRILLAVIGTWVVIEVANILNFSGGIGAHRKAGLLVIGFVVGAFPPVAWQVIQSAFRTVTGARFFVPSLRTSMPVSDLDGLTVWHQARLEEEDIENVPNMASADIVDLMLNTRIPPERIIDWVDQAILHTQLGSSSNDNSSKESSDNISESDRTLLRDHAIRNASSLIAAYQKSEERNDLEQFETIIPSTGRSRMRSLVDTLTNNPNLALVQRWRR
ncbi:MAG: hypothetical protein QNK24_11920 [Desulfuromusa sp.]|nr:hypothetical protein [Desulfuromusa sp.]